jgi:hypothetical protein
MPVSRFSDVRTPEGPGTLGTGAFRLRDPCLPTRYFLAAVPRRIVGVRALSALGLLTAITTVLVVRAVLSAVVAALPEVLIALPTVAVPAACAAAVPTGMASTPVVIGTAMRAAIGGSITIPIPAIGVAVPVALVSVMVMSHLPFPLFLSADGLTIVTVLARVIAIVIGLSSECRGAYAHGHNSRDSGNGHSNACFTVHSIYSDRACGAFSFSVGSAFVLMTEATCTERFRAFLSAACVGRIDVVSCSAQWPTCPGSASDS